MFAVRQLLRFREREKVNLGYAARVEHAYLKDRIRLIKHSQGPSAAPRLEALWAEAMTLTMDAAYLSVIANMIADTYRGWSKHDDASRYAHHAIEHEKRAPNSPLLGNHYLFLVTVMQKRGDDPTTILPIAEEGLRHYQARYGKDHSEVRYIRAMVEKFKRLA